MFEVRSAFLVFGTGVDGDLGSRPSLRAGRRIVGLPTM